MGIKNTTELSFQVMQYVYVICTWFYSNGSESIPDKNGFTPITALLNQIDVLDVLRNDRIDKLEKKAAKMIVIILEHKGISVIQDEYNGVPAIVDDMQRGRYIIVQVR